MSEKSVEEQLIDEIRDLKNQVFHSQLRIKQMNEKQRMHLATKVMEVALPQFLERCIPATDVADYCFKLADAMLERAKK